jgi:hypothetical protein
MFWNMQRVSESQRLFKESIGGSIDCDEQAHKFLVDKDESIGFEVSAGLVDIRTVYLPESS